MMSVTTPQPNTMVKKEPETTRADGWGDADLPADAELPSEWLDGWSGAQVLVQPVVEAVAPRKH